MEKTKLSPPWWEYYHKLDAMFSRDPDIHMEFDEENLIVKMYVDNGAKADALKKVLPAKKEFGNVEVTINIIPSNKVNDIEQIYKTIFAGNPIFSDAMQTQVAGVPVMTYVIFKPLIVQFFNDNMADANRNLTALYQDIAKDVFLEQDGVYYCTESIRGN